MVLRRDENGNRFRATCLRCKAPLTGKRQSRFCSGLCRSKWHMKEKKRLEKCYSITGAAKLLGISRYAIAYAIEKKYINVILVPTAGTPRREITLRELEKLALRYDCSAPLKCYCSTCRTKIGGNHEA